MASATQAESEGDKDDGKGKRTLTRVGRSEQRRGGRILPRHLLQHGDEEPRLERGRALQERVQGGGALGFAQDAEPLLDRGQLVLEVRVERGGGHLFEGRLVVLQVFEPAIDSCEPRKGDASERAVSSSGGDDLNRSGRDSPSAARTGEDSRHAQQSVTCLCIPTQTERDRAERDSLSDADVVVVCDRVVPPNECPLSCGAPCPVPYPAPPPRYSLAGLSVAPDELTVRPGLEARLAAAEFGCAAARWCGLAFWRHERASTLARILALVLLWLWLVPVPAVVENEDESAKGRGATPAAGAAAAGGDDDDDDPAVGAADEDAVVVAGGLYLALAI